MFNTIKELGTQITTLAGDAVDGVTATVRHGADNMADKAGAAASSLNEKAVRAAIGQMRNVLQVAAEEMRLRPVFDRPVTLTTAVNIGFTSLEMQVVMDPVEPGDAVAPSPAATPESESGTDG